MLIHTNQCSVACAAANEVAFELKLDNTHDISFWTHTELLHRCYKNIYRINGTNS